MVASIVLKKIYFNGICALSKKNSQFHAFLCVRSKSQILRVKNVKNQNLTHPKAAKLATLSYTHLTNVYKGQNKGTPNLLRNVYDVSMYNSVMLHCALFTRTIQCSAGMCVYVSCDNQLYVCYQYYACTILCYLHIYSGITVQVKKSRESSVRHNILDHYFHCITTAYVFQNIIHVTGLKCLNDILITYLVHRIIINSSYISSSCTIFFIYTTFIKRSIHKSICSNALLKHDK